MQQAQRRQIMEMANPGRAVAPIGLVAPVELLSARE
jgi:hypothetical protein